MDGPRYFNPWKQFVGSWVPAWLEERREISAGAKLLYARLARYAGQRGVAYPHQATVARAMGISVRTLRRHVAELRDARLITVRQRGTRSGLSGKSGKPAEYRFLAAAWMDGARKIARPEVAGQSGIARPDLAGQSGGDVKGSRARSLKRIKKEEETQRCAPRGRAAPGGRSQRDTEKPKGRGHARAQALVAGLIDHFGGTTRRTGS